ncbi:MAG TPA: NADH-quinone oxidoreductase subunit N [Tepidisphaeraceae bacterium]|jgi:NADH-quinone oxidoreductase subunit N|nr:NADH-quinone oxidoreductase subunit N [Tepidisphaeraceae bacterium]
MNSLLYSLWPELLLTATACLLFVLGAVPSANARRLVPILAVAALLAVVFGLLRSEDGGRLMTEPDFTNTVLVGKFALYIKLLSAAVAILFVLLSWPTDPARTGNSALNVGTEVGEFFALMLLSITGIFLVASANDIILLFLGIELASIPTYIMVSISRPLPVAQEAGVKYFFLGAMAAALMLFGFSYLYGTTGSTSLLEIRSKFHPGMGTGQSAWQLLAVIMLLMGFAFKLAAVPLHTYAGDVYQGAATPVTALLAFVPKTSGIVALIKLLAAASGPDWHAPDVIIKLLWIIAVLTMTVGNILGLMQSNIKRVFAYSSVAHSGYMLVALTALIAAFGLKDAAEVQTQALAGVLFYLCAYGIMNTGAFGVLMMLPGRTDTHGRHDADGNPLPTAGSAETFDDIAGLGRRHIALGLAMAVACFSLTGLPLTVGFLGKILIITPALAFWHTPGHPFAHMMIWLVVLTMINAAISAAYYLKIVAFLFLRPEHGETIGVGAVPRAAAPLFRSVPVTLAIVLSVFGTLYFGMFWPGISDLTTRVKSAAAGFVQLPGTTATATPKPAAVLSARADAR